MGKFLGQLGYKGHPLVDHVLVPALEGDEDQIDLASKIVWKDHLLAIQIATFNFGKSHDSPRLSRCTI